MRIVFASDLHGRENLYEELFRLSQGRQADCLLLGGDLLPTRIGGVTKLITGTIDLDASLQAQLDFIDTFLAPRLNAFIRTNFHTRVLYIPGNHDWIPAMKHLEETVPGAGNIHQHGETYQGFLFYGYGCVTDSTFWVKDYVRRDLPADGPVPSRFACISTPEGIRLCPDGTYLTRHPSMTEDLAGLRMDDPGRTICLFHAPPYASGLDTLHNGKPIGSRAIRTFIETCQPLLTLHGHIHESPVMSGIYHALIGRTLAVNPGHDRERLHAVTFDTAHPHSPTHTLFGQSGPVPGEDRLTRYARICKAFAMKTVLTK